MLTELHLGISILVPLVGLVSGLIGAYVGLQNRALLAEVRQELAELENRMFSKINGTYIRRGECQLREESLTGRLATLEEETRHRNRHGQHEDARMRLPPDEPGGGGSR